MVRFVKRLMLFIPFGHLFIGGRKEKKINLNAATVSLHCNTFLWKPYRLKNAFDLISWNITLFSTPIWVYFRHISDALNEQRCKEMYYIWENHTNGKCLFK